MGLSALRGLFRRCKETYDFPYDLYDFLYALRFFVSKAQPLPLTTTYPLY